MLGLCADKAYSFELSVRHLYAFVFPETMAENLNWPKLNCNVPAKELPEALDEFFTQFELFYSLVDQKQKPKKVFILVNNCLDDAGLRFNWPFAIGDLQQVSATQTQTLYQWTQMLYQWIQGV